MSKKRDEYLRNREDGIQGQAVRELSCSQPKERPEITRKEGIYLLQQIIPVGVKGEKGIVEITLKNAVGTIHWTIGHGIDDMVSAANMAGGSWAGFQASSVKMGQEEMRLTNPDGILHRKISFDQGSLILNPFYRGMGETF